MVLRVDSGLGCFGEFWLIELVVVDFGWFIIEVFGGWFF